MIADISRHTAVRVVASVAVGIGLSLAASAHNIVGTKHPDSAKARLSRTLDATCTPVSSLTPIEGTNLSVACFDVQNLSPDDARITGIGFDLPGELGDFVLVSPTDFGVELSSYANFELRNDVSRVPGFPDTVLDFALLTGKGFAQGKAADGIGPNLKTTICVKGPFPADLEVENLLDYVYVRFQNVGPHGESSDVGRP